MASAWGSSWGNAWANAWGSISVEQALAANDIASASSVTHPAAIIGRTLLANDVISASSVTQPAAGIQRTLLANDITSASNVSNPILGIVGIVQGRDIISASSVTSPTLHQAQVLDAVNVASASSVTTPAVAEIVAGVEHALLANDIVSGSSVSQPRLNPADVIVIPPELPLGGAGAGGGGAYRKAWQREFDRRRAREEGLTLRQYLDQIEVAGKELPRKADRTSIARSVIAVRKAIDGQEAFSDRLAEMLGEALTAAEAEQFRVMVRRMQTAALQAAELQRQALIEAEDARQATMIEMMLYDDALATILLLSA